MRTAQLSVLLLALLMLGVSTGCGKRGARPINTQDGDTDRVELLGTRKVDFKGDFDTIMVTLKEGTFHAIRVDVEGSAIEMWDIDVFFSNGGHEDFNTRLNFAEGSWSRRIDLRGDLAVDTGTWHNSWRQGDGETQSASGGYLVVWERDFDGRWRIAYDMWQRPVE